VATLATGHLTPPAHRSSDRASYRSQDPVACGERSVIAMRLRPQCAGSPRCWTGCMRAGWMTGFPADRGPGPGRRPAPQPRPGGQAGILHHCLLSHPGRPGRRGGRYRLRRLRGRRARQAAAPGMGQRATPRADPVRVSRGRDRTLSHRLQRPPHRGRRKATGQTADTTLIGGYRLACPARHGQYAGRQRLARLTSVRRRLSSDPGRLSLLVR